MTPQQYCLRWKYHHSNVQNMFSQLLEKERFCDVTLYCSPNFATQVPNKDTVEPENIRGVSLRAHRVVLAACSELLGTLLGAHEAQGEPVLVIDGAEPKHLKALLEYMYTGEMNVHHSQLASLLKTAEELRIKGLTDIRWNNKDEPPDCSTGAVAATAVKQEKPDKQEKAEPKLVKPAKQSPVRVIPEEPKVKKEVEEVVVEKSNVNGGPPPLIKLPVKDKNFNQHKRENSDSDSPSPKRQRLASGTENTDDESVCTNKTERDLEWQHGNLDITAERVVGWGADGSADSSRELSDDEWADAPADIGSFLDTRLRVDGDNSADEESNASGNSRPSSTTASNEARSNDTPKTEQQPATNKATVGPKSGPTDPRFTDVIKLNDYLQHGRRPQFWEEHYVKRVMEAVRLKELEMKQAAEILGVSYGTLYGRYRDVYGCINRPYRAVRDFWQVKGPSEVLERLQRGEMSLDSAATALGVSVANLAAHVADFGHMEFDPIPIEIDASLRNRSYSGASTKTAQAQRKPTPTAEQKQQGPRYKLDIQSCVVQLSSKCLPRIIRRRSGQVRDVTPSPDQPDNTALKQLPPAKRVVVGSTNDEESIPVSIISTAETKTTPTNTTTRSPSTTKWPAIRVANIDTLRSDPPASPSQLMKTRPDLTIVAAKKQDT